MKKSPLVSIIIPTKNSEAFLLQCLKSIKNQTYREIEIIVVDNFSTDKTISIAKKFTNKIFYKGPERSAQKNYGVSKAKGTYIYIVDSDFVLEKQVVSTCVSEIKKGFDSIVVHNTPDETINLLAKIRKFEIDMYKYDLSNSSARFFKKTVYQKCRGYNPDIIFGEDYDLQNRVTALGYKTGFVHPEAIHLGEPRSLIDHMKKMYMYGKDSRNYTKNNKQSVVKQALFIRKGYIKNWKRFIYNPTMSFLFISYMIVKYTAGGFGYIASLLEKK